METIDFRGRTYIIEVLRSASRSTDAILSALRGLTTGPRYQLASDMEDVEPIHHAYYASPESWHRVERSITEDGGDEVRVPRTKVLRGERKYLYDVVFASRGRECLLAVPFHRQAEKLFVQLHDRLSGTRTKYKKLDVGQLIARLGPRGLADGASLKGGSLKLSRCHLSYSSEDRCRHIQKIVMIGENLGKAEIYRALMRPVFGGGTGKVQVTPSLLGIIIEIPGLRPLSLVADRHGNFKMWLGARPSKIIRVFQVLDVLYAMGVVEEDGRNVPILRDEEIASVS